MQIRVYYEDTDCGNVVYYANYLKYMERSRTEYLRDRGIDLSTYHDQGLLFTVTEAHLRYHASAHYNDLLEVGSSVTEITPVTILFSTDISLSTTGKLLVTGEVRVACVTTAGKPSRIPPEMKAALSGG
ncbi:MAG: YbgC/FadM family acyl-CoA thioesterase [Chitinispirillaceae bacterium]|nr:YbgC/FadM family acyl-CoA thioesterase [Chitinispirillaceae bacterium]